MFEIGVKLWSTNTGGCMNDVRRLCAEGSCDYLELYAVPGTLDTLPQWQALGVPTVIHAPHFKHGFNLAQRESAQLNRVLYDETRRFADALGARYIIFHGGTFGCITETARQLAALQEPRALIENKPAITHNDGCTLACRGATVAEIEHVLTETGCGFCLDIPHALCAANYHHSEQGATLRDFRALGPAMYHLADMMEPTLLIDDHTQLGHGCLDMGDFIPDILQPGAMVTIETNRRSHDDLSEFEAELVWLRGFLHAQGVCVCQHADIKDVTTL